MPNLEFPCNLSLGHTARCQLPHAAALVIRDRLATPIFPICFSFGDAFSLPFQHHLPFELGNTWYNFSDIGPGDLRPAGSLFASASSPIGPITLAVGQARGGSALYFIIGRIF